MAQKNTDLDKIKELIDIMQENELVELEIKHGDDKIFLKRAQPQQPAVTVVPSVNPNAAVIPVNSGATKNSASHPDISAPLQEGLIEIKSPMVGTFYATPSPDSDPYVEINSRVEPHTVVCIIEAMKVMNEIKSDNSGKIAEILVKNGQAVEYGQVLFRIEPD